MQVRKQIIHINMLSMIMSLAAFAALLILTAWENSRHEPEEEVESEDKPEPKRKRVYVKGYFRELAPE